MRLIVVLLLPCWRPRQIMIIIVFFSIIPLLFRLIVACYSSFSTPHSPAYIPIDCCVVLCGFCGHCWPLSFQTEVKCPLASSFVQCSAASAVIVTAMAAESMPLTPPPVVETFVRLLVGFGVVGAAIWRLSTMVG